MSKVEAADPPLLLPCPHCRQMTDSMKFVNTGTLLFLVLAWSVQRVRIAGCPTCCQKSLVKRAAVNTVTANVLWPIIYLPWTIINLRKTVKPGHDPELLKELDLPLPTAVATPVKRPLHEAFPYLARVVGGAQIVLGLLIGWFFLLAVSDGYYKGLDPDPTTPRIVGGVGLTLAGYLLVTGIARVMLTVPRALARLGIAAVIGIGCWLTMNGLVDTVWRVREASYARGVLADSYSARDEYEWHVPEKFWTAPPIGVIAGAAYDRYDIENLLEAIEKHHANDSSFEPIVKLLKEKQAKLGE